MNWTTLLPVLAGPLVAAATAAAKNAPSIPLNTGDTAKIRLAVACASVILGGALSYLSTSTLDGGTLVQGVIDAVVVYTGAVATNDHTPAT